MKRREADCRYMSRDSDRQSTSQSQSRSSSETAPTHSAEADGNEGLSRRTALKSLAGMSGLSAGVLTSSVESSARPSADTTPTYGPYTIMSRHSGKALEVAGWSKANGANIHQWELHGGKNQLWRYYEDSMMIENVHSGKLLTVEGPENGANVYQMEPLASGGKPTQRQQWIVNRKEKMIKNVASGKALEVAGWGTKNGANIQQWKPHSGANQTWNISQPPVWTKTVHHIVEPNSYNKSARTKYKGILCSSLEFFGTQEALGPGIDPEHYFRTASHYTTFIKPPQSSKYTPTQNIMFTGTKINALGNNGWIVANRKDDDIGAQPRPAHTGDESRYFQNLFWTVFKSIISGLSTVADIGLKLASIVRALIPGSDKADVEKTVKTFGWEYPITNQPRDASNACRFTIKDVFDVDFILRQRGYSRGLDIDCGVDWHVKGDPYDPTNVSVRKSGLRNLFPENMQP